MDLRNLYFSRDKLCFVPTYTARQRKLLLILTSLSASATNVD